MEINNQNQIKKGEYPRLPWSTPALQVLSVDHIRQQEEELLYYALANDDSFRLLTGSLQQGG